MNLRALLSHFTASICVALALCSAVSKTNAQTFIDPGFSTEVVATLSPYTLVGMAWAPDGRLFIWQKNGVVRIIKNGVLLPTPFIDLSAKVNTYDDRGFWGLAFDPNFATNRYVYMTYVFENAGNPNSSSPRTSRLVRVTANPANPDVALTNSEVAILGTIGTPPCSAYPAGSDCIGADGGSHTLGTIRFAPDGKMFVGNGDGSDGDAIALLAQDLGSYSGKILRINTDGTAAVDNPFYDGTNSIRSKVWLYGVRNPFRFALHPTTSDIYFGDVGWNTWEEVNRGVQGANYGWPCYEGSGAQPFFQSTFTQCQQLPASAVTPPIYTYDHSFGSAAIGGPIYSGTTYPAQYRGNFFFVDYSGNWIQRVVLDANGLPTGVQPFATNVPAPVTLEQGPDGLMYYLSFTTGEIRRIRYNGSVAVASATPVHGYSPLTVSFSSAGSRDTAGGPITYLWNFGDGTTSTQANPTHTYSASGVTTFTATLTVKNSANATASATVNVTVGSTPPTPVISTPASGTSVMPGQTVFYQGSATDPDDGALPDSALTWTVLLHHNTHVHTFVGGTGSQGHFLAEDHGSIGTFSYEIVLTATDSSGLKASTSVNVAVAADTVAPTAPSALAATVVGSSINLNWTASTDNAAVSGYRVERCQGTGCTNFTQIAAPSTTNYSDAGLASATSYSYRVRAVDASSNLGNYSNTASGTISGTAPPSGLVAAYAFNEGTGTTAADSSGNGNTGTINGASWSTSGRFGAALSFNGSSNTVRVPSAATLNPSTAMTLEAWIYPTASQSSWRTIVQKETDAYFLNASNDNGPLLPSGGGTFGSSTVFVSGSTASPINTWTHVALTYDGATLRLYVNGVLANSQARTGAIQSTASPLWIGGNSPYGEYFQGRIDEVRIYNRALSQAEIQSDMTTPVGSGSAPSDTTPPSAPSGVTATVVSNSQINLSWTASTDNVGVTGYRVERCQGASCTNFAQVGTPTTTSFSNTGLSANTTYRFRVRASDAAGNLSAYSSVASGTTTSTTDTTAPTAPTGLAATAAGANQINLSWTASTDNVGVTGYRVERCQGTGCTNFTQVGTPTTTSFANTGLTASTTYLYRVRAADASGNLSGYSNTASASTGSGSSPPSGLVAAYAFNAGTGTTAADSSGNGNNGTINGASWTTSGRFGAALSFNGSSNTVRVPSAATLNPSTAMTLEAWIYPTASQSSWRTIVQKETDAYFLNASNDNGPLLPSGGGTFASSTVFVSGSTASPVNTWTHVALTYDGATLRLYVNGVLANSQARTGTIQSTTSPLWIGGNSPYGEYFQGRIDEVRIYNRALSQAEIQADMNTAIGP